MNGKGGLFMAADKILTNLKINKFLTADKKF